MHVRRPIALTLALVVTGAGAATALATTAESIAVDFTNSKSLRRLALVADVSECDVSGGYGCYRATFSVFAAGGRRIVERPLPFDANGEARTVYRWTCRHAGVLRWRVDVTDGEANARRSARFRVSRC